MSTFEGYVCKHCGNYDVDKFKRTVTISGYEICRCLVCKILHIFEPLQSSNEEK